MRIDAGALHAVRDHLDAMMYRLTDFRMSVELPPSRTGFPRYEALRRIVCRLNPEHETVFRLFRLGEIVDDKPFRAAFPDGVVSALLRTRLVVRSADGWRTPGLLVVPTHGLLLITGIPPDYPTAAVPPRAWFDLSTSFVAAGLPTSLVDRRVLDVCSGVGTQALLCAARGASSVVGLELSDSAVVLARANAALNGLASRVEFRESDLLGALRANECFDFVVANLPYAPVFPPGRPATSVAEIGNGLLWPLLDTLPAHLAARAEGLLAIWRTIGHHQLHAIMARLTGYVTTAYADPVADTVDGADPAEGCYNQLVSFRHATGGDVPGPTFARTSKP